MHIASVSQHTAVMPRTPEAKEAPGPDHDGDKDDAAVKSAPKTGVGSLVDTTA